MKEMNRREFLTLTGAAVVALSLAGCGAPSAPAAPTGKEAKLAAAINKVWKEKYKATAVDHEQLTLNQDAVDFLSAYGHILEKANETTHTLIAEDNVILSNETLGLAEKLNKYGAGSLAGMAGISEPSTANVVTLEDEYSCEDTAVRTFVAKLLNNSDSAKAEFISIYLPVVKNVTYMTAVVFRNNNP